MMDYLDTGLFLDHRETRQLVAKECKGKKLLNLFAYTCSFSVQASFMALNSLKVSTCLIRIQAGAFNSIC
jgi:hypothetical protein